jgi:hypothetical protein
MTRATAGKLVPAILFVSTITLAGCEPAPGSVKGVVTIKGAPPKVANLTVNALTIAGQSVSVPLQPDGSFTIADLPPGPVQLGVSVVDTEPQTREEVSSKTVSKNFALGAQNHRPPPKQPFAEKYLNPRTSGFSTVVESGKTVVLDINIP